MKTFRETKLDRNQVNNKVISILVVVAVRHSALKCGSKMLLHYMIYAWATL